MSIRYIMSWSEPGDGITQWPFANTWLDQTGIPGGFHAPVVAFTTTTNAGLELNQLTTTERLALTPNPFSFVGDTNTTTPWYYNGSSWVEITSGGGSLVGFTTSSNTALGVGALGALSSGTANDAYGVSALDSITTENDNYASGYQAGMGLTGISNCTFVGKGTTGLSNKSYQHVFGQGAYADSDKQFAISDHVENVAFRSVTSISTAVLTTIASPSYLVVQDGGGTIGSAPIGTYLLPSFAAQAYAATNQTIPATINTIVNFGNTAYDPQAAFNTSTSTYTVVADCYLQVAGTLAVSFSAATGIASVSATVAINGSSEAFFGWQGDVTGLSNLSIPIPVKTYAVNASDTVNIYIEQVTSAATFVVAAGSADSYVQFNVLGGR